MPVYRIPTVYQICIFLPIYLISSKALVHELEKISLMRLHLDLQWQLQQEDELLPVPASLFQLLDEIALGKNLRSAAAAIDISYRNAWGQIETWEKRLNNKLVIRERGRGTTLTPFAVALLEAKASANEKLRPELDVTAETTSGHLTRMLGAETSALRIVSSHHELINQFANKLRETSKRRVAFDVIGSETALRRYQRADADICGFHIPTGAPYLSLAEHLLSWLDGQRDQIFFLEDRALGLISHPKRAVSSLEELVKMADLRFINRQAGSATRLVFDNLLDANKIQAESLTGYEDEEHTHTAVAARIASGDRDVGFGEASAAKKFSLMFSPIVRERFYLALKCELQTGVKNEIAAFFNQDKRAAYQPKTLEEMLNHCKNS